MWRLEARTRPTTETDPPNTSVRFHSAGALLQRTGGSLMSANQANTSIGVSLCSKSSPTRHRSNWSRRAAPSNCARSSCSNSTGVAIGWLRCVTRELASEEEFEDAEYSFSEVSLQLQIARERLALLSGNGR